MGNSKHGGMEKERERSSGCRNGERKTSYSCHERREREQDNRHGGEKREVAVDVGSGKEREREEW